MTYWKIGIYLFVILCLPKVLAAQEVEPDTIYAERAKKLAIKFKNEQNFTSALFYYNLAIRRFEGKAREHNDSLIWQETVDCLNQAGDIYRLTSDFEKAQELLSRAAELGEKHLSECNLIRLNTDNNLGILWAFKGDLDQSLHFFQTVLEGREKVLGKSHVDVAKAHNNLGLIYDAQGNSQQAFQHQRVALEIRLEQLDTLDPVLADSYLNLGNAFFRAADLDSSAYCFEKALEILRNQYGDEHIKTATAYNNLGVVYEERRDFEEALIHYQEAMNIRKKILGPSDLSLSDSYLNMGNILLAQKKFNQAEENYLRCIKLRENILKKTDALTATAYNNLGILYADQKDYTRSIEFHQRALAMRKELLGQYHAETATSFNNLGNSYFRNDQFQKAQEHYEAALEIWQNTFNEFHREIALTYFNLGELNQNKQDFDMALSYFQQALQAIDPFFTPANYFENPSLENSYPDPYLVQILQAKAATLGELYRHANEKTALKAALETFQLGVYAANELRHSYNLAASKEMLMKTFFPLYESALELLYVEWQKSPRQEIVQQAFKMAQGSKSVLLSEALQNSKAEKFAGIPDSMRITEKRLKKEISQLQQEITLLRLTTNSVDSIQLPQLETQRFQSQRKLDSVIAIMENDYPNYYALKYDFTGIELGQIQEALSPQSTYIEYVWGDQQLFLVALSRDSTKFHAIPIDSSFRSLVIGFIQQLNDPRQRVFMRNKMVYDRFTSLSRALYQHLVEPVWMDGTKQLIIVPDGPLGYLPFEVLFTQDLNVSDTLLAYSHLPYLLKECSVRYGYAAAFVQGNDYKSTKQAKKLFLGFAPEYAAENPSDLAFRKGFEQLPQNMNIEFKPLKYNVPEVQELASLLKGDVYLNESASISNFIEKAGQYQILHLAMHNLILDQHPNLSGLVFSEEDSAGSFLLLSDLYNLELGADLVVLSACETGKGEIVRGEGIMSVGRAFKYAGAQNMVMTLWSVQDQSTKTAMQGFYHYLKQGLGKDKALRQVKLDMIQSGEYAHPFYWAPFVLVGDSQPIRESSYPIGIYFMIGLMVLILAGFIGYFAFKKNSP